MGREDCSFNFDRVVHNALKVFSRYGIQIKQETGATLDPFLALFFTCLMASQGSSCTEAMELTRVFLVQWSRCLATSRTQRAVRSAWTTC